MYETTLTSKQQLTNTIWEFQFSKPPGYDYLAGQATKLSLLGVHDNRGVARWLSFASSPKENTLRFITRISDNSSPYKQALRDYSSDQNAYLETAMGSFAFPIKSTHPIICIASGVGIAPFRSLLIDNASARTPHKVKMALRSGLHEDMPYENELSRLSEHILKEPNSSIFFDTLLLSLIRQHSITPHKYYVAGTQAFVDRVTAALYKGNVAERMIITDPYHGYE